jgi:3-oxoacyl-[acyl-carrier protein] reductase
VDPGLNLGLAGARALVTGGSRGVGRATARMLAALGAEVGIAYHRRRADAEALVAGIAAAGGRSWSIDADLSTASGADRMFERLDHEWGGELDVVVASAGVWRPREVPLSEMSHEQWADTLHVNLTGVFHTLRHATRRMRSGGSIVLVSSTAAQRGEAFHADYAASKGALHSLAKSLAVELGERDVRVNCVAPGWIDTEMVAAPFAGGGRERIERGIPLGRVASAEDVAGPIVFLCSALARHITGEVLNVNGGSVLCG